jgi:hypothetical protein
MPSFRARRALPWLRAALFAGALAAGLASSGAAHADRNDLDLYNLCPPTTTGAGAGSCSWVQRTANGPSVVLDGEATSRYRSLMSELGVVIAPRLMTPADTLGFGGFQFSAELGVTKISNNKDFWNGVEGVDPNNPNAARPDSHLTTVGGFVRKGLWLPLPAFELGLGALSVLGSRMYSVQGYAKFAIQEGFQDWPLPSFAVRASVSQLLGTSQVNLTVFGIDALISKAFSVAGMARLEPFAGWNALFIDARSEVIDFTPNCDAVKQSQTASAAPAPDACVAADNGTFNDLNANFTFPSQDIIRRYRWFGGLKIKLSVFFLAAEYDIVQHGSSHDTSQPNGATDSSATQQSFSLSAGLDF